MASYIIDYYPVPEPIYRQIDSAIHNLSPKQRRFVLHVLASNLINLQKNARHGLDGWLDISVELPAKVIAKHFGDRFRVKLIPPTVLTIVPYSTRAHRCNAFKAADSLFNMMLDWSPATTAQATNTQIVNLFDGKPYIRPVLKQWEHGVFSSKLVRSAINCFGSCPFDADALEKHLDQLRSNAASAPPEKEGQMQAALRVDIACANRIRAGCQPQPSGFPSYVPEYRTSSTGRVTEVGGGAQGCSRAMKVALFETVPDVRNYDLKAAQANILLQELEDCGVARPWITRYLSTPNAAAIRASALGISKDAFKRCLYATIMGAPHRKVFDPKKNSIFGHVLRDCGGEHSARKLTVDVYAALAGLKSEVDAWHDCLLNDDQCPRLDPCRKRVRTLRNACGQHMKLEGFTSGKLARKAAAFILQGQEAAFIHHLTVLGSRHGFIPISNQHDGIVVVGVVPQEAVDAARQASGLRYGTLEKKSFL